MKLLNTATMARASSPRNTGRSSVGWDTGNPSFLKDKNRAQYTAAAVACQVRRLPFPFQDKWRRSKLRRSHQTAVPDLKIAFEFLNRREACCII